MKYFDHTFFRFFFGFMAILVASFAMLYVAIQWNQNKTVQDPLDTTAQVRSAYIW